MERIVLGLVALAATAAAATACGNSTAQDWRPFMELGSRVSLPSTAQMQHARSCTNWPYLTVAGSTNVSVVHLGGGEPTYVSSPNVVSHFGCISARHVVFVRATVVELAHYETQPLQQHVVEYSSAAARNYTLNANASAGNWSGVVDIQGAPPPLDGVALAPGPVALLYRTTGSGASISASAFALVVATNDTALLAGNATRGLVVLPFTLNFTCSAAVSLGGPQRPQLRVQRLPSGTILFSCPSVNWTISRLAYLRFAASAPSYGTNGTSGSTVAWAGVSESLFVRDLAVPTYVTRLPTENVTLMAVEPIVSRLYASAGILRVFAVSMFPPALCANFLPCTGDTYVWTCALELGTAAWGDAPPLVCAFRAPVSISHGDGTVYRTTTGPMLEADIDLAVTLRRGSVETRVALFPSYGNWSASGMAYESDYPDKEQGPGPTQRLSLSTRIEDTAFNSDQATISLTGGSSIAFMRSWLAPFRVGNGFQFWAAGVNITLLRIAPALGDLSVRVNGMCARASECAPIEASNATDAPPCGTQRAITVDRAEEVALVTADVSAGRATLAARFDLVEPRSGKVLSSVDAPRLEGASAPIYLSGVPPGVYDVVVRTAVDPLELSSIQVLRVAIVVTAVGTPDDTSPVVSGVYPIANVSWSYEDTGRDAAVELERAAGCAAGAMDAATCQAVLGATGATRVCSAAYNDMTETWVALLDTGVVAGLQYNLTRTIATGLPCNTTRLVGIPGRYDIAFSGHTRAVTVSGTDPYAFDLFAHTQRNNTAFGATVAPDPSTDGSMSRRPAPGPFASISVLEPGAGVGALPVAVALPISGTGTPFPGSTQRRLGTQVVLVAVVGGLVVWGPHDGFFNPLPALVYRLARDETPVAFSTAAADGRVRFLLESRGLRGDGSVANFYRIGALRDDRAVVFYDIITDSGRGVGSALGPNLLVYAGGTRVVPLSIATSQRLASTSVPTVLPDGLCGVPWRVSVDGMRVYCRNGTASAHVLRVTYGGGLVRWNEAEWASLAALPTLPVLSEADTPFFFNWRTGSWRFNVADVSPGVQYAYTGHTSPYLWMIDTPPGSVSLPRFVQTLSAVCTTPARFPVYPYAWRCVSRNSITADDNAFPVLMEGTRVRISVDAGVPDGRADGAAYLGRARGDFYETVGGTAENVYSTGGLILNFSVAAGLRTARFDMPGLPAWRVPSLETAQRSLASAVRICTADELVYACIIDERACLAVDSVVTGGTSAVVAVSCDAAFWASLTVPQTARANLSFWAESVASGALTWLRPTLARMSGSSAVPTHEGMFPPPAVTVPLLPTAVLDTPGVECTPFERLCLSAGGSGNSATLSSACNVTVHRSRVDGVTLFRRVLRTC